MKVLSYYNYWVKFMNRHSTDSACRGIIWGLYVALVTTTFLALLGLPLQAQELALTASELQKREKIQQLYEKQIPLLEQYVRKYPQGEKAANFLFRLGEAYFESAKFAQLQGQDSRSSLYTQKAIEALETLRRDHPYYERSPEALLVLASTYIEQGDSAKTGSVLAEIADRFPNSPIMEQASYLLGDYYFDKSKFAQAKTFYQQALKNEKSRAYANYKLAWVAIQQDQPGVALRHFEQVIKLNVQDGEKSFDYSRDAAREIVWPAIEVYSSAKVIPYLEGILKSAELLKIGLSGLAKGLNDKGEYAIASKVYAYLLQRFPQDAEAERWVSGQLEAEEKMGRSDQIAKLVSRLSGVAGNSPALRSKIYSNAKKYHSEAQIEKDPKRRSVLLDQAIAYYQAYFQLGDESPAKRAETSFYYGEALYARARFAEASKAYELAAKEPHDKQVDAVWNWYLTTEKTAPGFRYQGKNLQATSPDDERFLEAASFVAKLPNMDVNKRRKASYQSARLLYQLNDFDRALPIFETLAKQHAGTEEARLSAQLVLDIYNLRKDYAQVAQLAKDFQSSASGSEKSDLSMIEQKAVFKTIQEDETRAKAWPQESQTAELNRVAGRYLEFARHYPQSSFVDASIWAGLQLYANAASASQDKDFSELRASFQLLTQRYPNSKFAPEAIKLMGDFLTYIKPGSQMLSAYRAYRDTWLKQMRAQPATTRGNMGMMLYDLSNDSEKRSLEKEFASLPVTDDNREAVARGRIRALQVAHQNFESLSMSNIKTLKENTQKKMRGLEKFETEVTQFVQLGYAPLAVEALKLLSDAYSHMANSLRQAPVPSVLEGEDRQKYLNAVSEQAGAYDVKASEAKTAADKTAGLKG